MKSVKELRKALGQGDYVPFRDIFDELEAARICVADMRDAFSVHPDECDCPYCQHLRAYDKITGG